MDRCALFVDAGYALADGAMAVHGTRRRDSVSWDHAGLLKLLAGLARDRTGLPVLRCYWYEIAEGRRTAEHDSLAEMPGLKLRLVNTRPGRREGIESQLRRDLVTLAKSGAISDAFIASADEHLAEIVAEVQDLGLRVVILHIASDSGWTIPAPLRQECDDIVEISGVHLRPFVELIRGAEPSMADDQYASASYGSHGIADGNGSMAGALTHQGLPAVALPAPGPAYPAHAGSDYRTGAQPYASAGMMPAGSSAAYPGADAVSAPRAPSELHPSPQHRGLALDGSAPGGMGQGGMGQGGMGQGGIGQAGAGPASSAAQGTPVGAAPQNGAAPGAYAQGVSENGSAAHNGYQNGASHNAAGLGAQLLSGSAGNGSVRQGPVQQGPVQQGPGQQGPGHLGTGQPGPGMVPPAHGGYEAGSAQHGAGAGQGGAAVNGYPGGGNSQNGAAHNGAGQNGYLNGGGSHGQVLSGVVTTGYQNGAGYNGGGQHGYQNGAGLNGAIPGGYPNGAAHNGAGPGGVSLGGYQNGAGQNGAGQNGMGQNGIRQGSALPGAPQAGDQHAGLPMASHGGFDAAPVHGQHQSLYPTPEAGFLPGQHAGAGSDHQARAVFTPHQPQGPVAAYQPQPQAQYFAQSQAAAPSQAIAQGPAIRAAAPVAISLPEAVKAAHAEGFAFGESVGRDAPGLWLEAVLARKPRMPSDLEARLLQGSVLPIDSLLHDEVRHSLRRGFWDALESARR